MLSRSHRLSTRQLMEVMEKGRVMHSSLFLVRYMHAKDDKSGSKPSVFAAVVPTKVSKTAVGRHKLRRQMYEAIRATSTAKTTGYKIALFAKQASTRADFEAICRDIAELFSKAGLVYS